MPDTILQILDCATQITLDSIWASMVQEAIHNSKTTKFTEDFETASTTIVNNYT
jgi:hypothetical protein